MPPSPAERRPLGLPSAVVLGVASMVGAGVFVVPGPAAAAAGPLLWAALLLAAAVASANALAVAALASRHPEAGGAYLYGRRQLGPWPGFLAGWGFLTGKSASCAAMAYTFGLYAAPGFAVPLAVGAVAVLAGVNVLGVNRTAGAARLLLLPVLGVLAFACAAAFARPAAEPVAAGPAGTAAGTAQAAALFFFAFAGYARIATLGEEVRDPRRTIPRAVLLALAATLLLYGALCLALVHGLGLGALAASTTPVLALGAHVGLAGWVVGAAAALACLGSLLALLAGMSRTTLAMARDGELPRVLARVGDRHGAPWAAELACAVLVVAVLLTGELTILVGFSSFGVLVYYAVANAAAFTLAGRPWYSPRWLNAAGFAACLVLAASVPGPSAAVMIAVFAVGAAGRAVAQAAVRRRTGQERSGRG
ncbi:APC family permease [Zafaria sp. Z1313]|uniref:APC family permease n=1 Tax=unclassified Zafaria TaxID=2828765 RepID=UPI002E77ABC5|nr:APC family permease [Zafaria sp. J156]MEE1621110.1 APC family permease [Zafaria sp. J156]